MHSECQYFYFLMYKSQPRLKFRVYEQGLLLHNIIVAKIKYKNAGKFANFWTLFLGYTGVSNINDFSECLNPGLKSRWIAKMRNTNNYNL